MPRSAKKGTLKQYTFCNDTGEKRQAGRLPPDMAHFRGGRSSLIVAHKSVNECLKKKKQHRAVRGNAEERPHSERQDTAGESDSGNKNVVLRTAPQP